MKKLMIFCGALFLMLSVFTTAGLTQTQALFFDMDSGPLQTQMGIVDIALAPSHSKTNAEILNQSNIDIFLRAGVIIENETEIIDTGNITITSLSGNWEPVMEKITSQNGRSYTKWFLTYTSDGEFTRIPPEKESVPLAFRIDGLPPGCEFTVHIIPEALQAGEDGKALAAVPW